VDAAVGNGSVHVRSAADFIGRERDAFAIALMLAGGNDAAAPKCSVEAMKTVRYMAAGSVHIDAVPIDATLASAGLPDWDDTGERFTAYRCIVTPHADGRWSGRADDAGAERLDDRHRRRRPARLPRRCRS
jgi:hypothetical protein